MATVSQPVSLEPGLIAEHSTLPMIIMDRDLRIRFANQAYKEAVRRPDEDLLGRWVFDVYSVPPEREKALTAICNEAFAGQVTHSEVNPYKQADANGRMQTRYWQSVQEPLRNAKGEVEYIIQRVHDVTHLVSLQQSNDVIAAELDHRVKNLITVILATARISSAGAMSVEQYTEEFCGRVESLARTHNKLTENGWRGLSLRSIIEDELAIAGCRDSGRYSLKGDDITLLLKASKDGGMVFHEMVANAVKHGCFSQEGGRLDVEWMVEGGNLRVVWSESGLSGVSPPVKEGFGAKLFAMMPNAMVRHEYRETGLLVEYIVPARNAIEGDEPESGAGD